MVILVTGSRDWTNYGVIWRALEDEIVAFGSRQVKDILLIHGAAIGADRLAAIAGRRLGLGVKGYRANWDRYGKKAGPIRNRKMLDLHPHVVLAFPLPQSIGTVDCMDEAKRRGIEVKEFKP